MIHSLELKDETGSEASIRFQTDSKNVDALKIICKLDGETWVIDFSKEKAIYIRDFLKQYL